MVFDLLDAAALLVALAICLIAGLLMRRTLLYRKGASLHCAVRLAPFRGGYGWHLGLARYTPTHLQCFRLFSLAPGPKLAVPRRTIEVVGRRHPRGFEHHAIPYGAVIMICTALATNGRDLRFELALSESALTGLSAWLESSPPGVYRPRDRHR